RIARVKATFRAGATGPALVVAAVIAGAAAPPALSAPTIAGCPVMSPTSAWNQKVDRAPVARNSATLIRSIGLTSSFHADFRPGTWDGGPIGIPYTVVSSAQPKVKVTFDYADESDRHPYP